MTITIGPVTNPSDIQVMVERLRYCLAEALPESGMDRPMYEQGLADLDTLERLSLPAGEDAVERVARAIFAAEFSPDEDPALIEVKWNEWPEDQKRARRMARAALSALPAPVHAVEDARIKILAWLGAYRDGLTPQAVRCLQAIADELAALTPSPAPAQEVTEELENYEAAFRALHWGIIKLTSDL